MSEQPNRNNYIERNFEHIHGDYHEHRYATPSSNTEALDAIRQAWEELKREYPNAATANSTNPDIIDAEFEEIKQNNHGKWQRLMDLFSVLFAGGFEAVKMTIPQAGIPIEVGRRLYEIYQRDRSERKHKSLPDEYR